MAPEAPACYSPGRELSTWPPSLLPATLGRRCGVLLGLVLPPQLRRESFGLGRGKSCQQFLVRRRQLSSLACLLSVFPPACFYSSFWRRERDLPQTGLLLVGGRRLLQPWEKPSGGAQGQEQQQCGAWRGRWGLCRLRRIGPHTKECPGHSLLQGPKHLSPAIGIVIIFLYIMLAIGKGD